jgi:hypothetical protein
VVLERLRDPDWRRRRVRPWAGFLLGGTAWVLSHQYGSDLVQDDCRWGQPGVMAIIGIIALAVALTGALLSLLLWRASNADQSVPEDGAVRFIAAVSGLAGILFSLAIIAQTLSGFIIPACAS